MQVQPEKVPKKQNYKSREKLGEGSFGKAYLVEDEDKNLYVIKTVFLEGLKDDEIKRSLAESKILEKLDHPNIIRFKESFMQKKPKLSLCIVMDYCDGGDLKKHILKQKNQLYKESVILDMFTQICLAVKHIHDRKILHRDLKSQNIFLTKNGLLKLGDFGVAKSLDSTVEQSKTMVGTPYYVSPEMARNEPYSFKSDIWALGVILYEMAALRLPFTGDNMAALIMKIMQGKYEPLPEVFSSDLRKLVSDLLNLDDKKRPLINEILKYPIIKSRIKSFLDENKFIEEFSQRVTKTHNTISPTRDIGMRKKISGENNDSIGNLVSKIDSQLDLSKTSSPDELKDKLSSIGTSDKKDFVQAHRMFVELKKIHNDEEVTIEDENNIDSIEKSIQINDNIREVTLDATEIRKTINYEELSGYSKLELIKNIYELKMALEEELTEQGLENTIKLIKDDIDLNNGKYNYDAIFNKIKKNLNEKDEIVSKALKNINDIVGMIVQDEIAKYKKK